MIYIIILIVGVFLGMLLMWIMHRHTEEVSQKYVNDLKTRYDTMNRWLYDRDSGRSVACTLENRGIKSIAIYGLSDMGLHIIGDLKDSNIEISYLVDRRADAPDYGYAVYTPADDLKPVDAMIITTVNSYNKVCQDLKKKLDTDFISVFDII